MIKLTPEEITAFNILALKAQEAQNLLNNAVAAQNALISLCEIKYGAVYDEKTGQFKEKG